MCVLCIAVKAPTHPSAEWEYFIRDSESSIIVTTDEYSKELTPIAQKLNIRLIILHSNNTFVDTHPHFSVVCNISLFPSF
jgi:hypothetical protein